MGSGLSLPVQVTVSQVCTTGLLLPFCLHQLIRADPLEIGYKTHAGRTQIPQIIYVTTAILEKYRNIWIHMSTRRYIEYFHFVLFAASLRLVFYTRTLYYVHSFQTQFTLPTLLFFVRKKFVSNFKLVYRRHGKPVCRFFSNSPYPRTCRNKLFTTHTLAQITFFESSVCILRFSNRPSVSPLTRFSCFYRDISSSFLLSSVPIWPSSKDQHPWKKKLNIFQYSHQFSIFRLISREDLQHAVMQMSGLVNKLNESQRTQRRSC